MKKIVTLLLAMLMVLALAGCTKKAEPEPQPEPEPAPDTSVMTYAEYAALPADGSAEVVIESNVQAAQSYWDGGASLYLQDEDGAYFVYAGQMSEEDYALLVGSTEYGNGWMGFGNGAQVHVEGTKTEWAGEVEISDAVVTLVENGTMYLSPSEDVTALLGTDGLAEYMNKKVKFTGMVVEPYRPDANSEETLKDENGNEVAFAYAWDGSGAEGSNSDLYFTVSVDGENFYNFVVESYLCYEGSDVYEAVKGLTIGDVVDLEGFLYWYNGANPHIYSAIVK